MATYLNEPISQTVWDIKYRYRYQNQIMDQTIEDTWQRVSLAVAKAELPDNQLHWQKKFYDILNQGRFLPGGRILAGAGTKHHVTLFNCFVMNIAEDSLTGIFEALKEGALTLQQGGGVGYDFSVLRPHGQLVKKTGLFASGPVSFMRIWNTTCGILLSTGARRGAMMGILRCDHPDIEEFINAKANPLELRHFNVSVLVTDAFMQAVKEDQDWALVFPVGREELEDTSYGKNEIIRRAWHGEKPVACRVFKRVKARELWSRIIKSAYEYAEPGVIFEDTINRMNNLNYAEWISATNPCGEIPLPAYGACNLGAINLTQFIKKPFTSDADLDWQGIEKTATIATRFLDNVVDVSSYPLKAQANESYATRRIGLGFTGLGDVFVMLGIRYGSDASLKLAQRIMEVIAYATWQTSIDLAKEKGVFPLFQYKNYGKGNFVKTLPVALQKQIAQSGIRNSHHNTIAPAGTISLLANNISNGLEPIFAPTYERFVRQLDEQRVKFNVTSYALREWQKLNKTEKLPPAWVDSQSLTPQDHLKIQGAIQPYIDNAISKTINLPENFPFEDLNEVYTQAHAMGLKGCTIFRPNPITGSVLQTNQPEEEVDRCCQIE